MPTGQRSSSPLKAEHERVSACTLFAPAKINLSLHVCGRRTDGYHLLDSLVVFAGVGDRITARPAEDLRLALDGPYGEALRAEPDNLVLRACRLLADRLKRPAAIDLRLEKILPVAAGIGGGSSDAAAALLAAARLWDLELGSDGMALRELAPLLGADVPVCLTRAPARMSGIGEIIAPIPPLPAAWLLLVNPGVPLATKAVFSALAGRYSGPLPALPEKFGTVEGLAAYLVRCRNDLAAPAIELMPAIAEILAALERADGCLLGRLSGSGPTCFGLFAKAEAAARAAREIATAHPGWWVAEAPVLTPSDHVLDVLVA